MTSPPQQPINPEVSPSAPELSTGAMFDQPASFWIASLASLGLYRIRGWRPTLLVACVFAVLGLIGTIDARHDISSRGALTVFGITYRYLGAAWGLYLVMAGTIVMTLSVASLTWRAFRSPSSAA
jgi:hypothetical protein